MQIISASMQPCHIRLAPAHLNKQRAGAVAALGMIYAAKGLTQTAEEHAPDYLRLSQAERERAEHEVAQANA